MPNVQYLAEILDTSGLPGGKEAAKVLRDRGNVVQEHLTENSKRYRELLSKPHDDLGRVLKCHLIVERYLDDYLQAKFTEIDFKALDLNFAKKLTLIAKDSKAGHLYAAIKELNEIRNRFGHRLEYSLTEADVRNMKGLVVQMKFGSSSPIKIVEHFAAIATSALSHTPQEVDDVLFDAFKCMGLGLKKKKKKK